MDVPVNKVADFESEYIFYLRKNHNEVLDNLRDGKLIDSDLDILRQVATDLAGKYSK